MMRSQASQALVGKELIMSDCRQFRKSTNISTWSRLIAVLLALLVLGSAGRVAAEEITVAAAADLTFAFQDVAAKYQKDTGNSVKFSYGSSGNFFSQIKNGAPF